MRQRLLSRILAPAVLAAGVGLAVPVATLATAPAAQATQPQICTNINWCMNAWGGGPAVNAYSPGASNENFTTESLTRCGGDTVTTTCPFTVGLGLNNLFHGDLIFQVRYNGSFGGCVGGTGNATLVACNYTSQGTGGGVGTVLVAAPEGGGQYTIVSVHNSDSRNQYGNSDAVNTNGGNGAAVVMNDTGNSYLWSSTTGGL